MKKKIFTILLLLTLLIPTLNVSAKTKIVETGNTLNLKEDYDSSTFFAGNTVKDKANVKGISFVAGNIIEFTGTSEYGLLAGNSITINGKVEKDLLMAGNLVTIEKDSVIGRDLYLFGTSVTLSGEIKRNINISADEITLEDVTVDGNFNLSATTINIEDNVNIKGKLNYNAEAKINNLDKATIKEVTTYKASEVNKTSITDIIFNIIISMLSMLLLGITINLLFPKVFKKLEKNTENYKLIDYLKQMLIGFVSLIVVPIMCVLLLVMVIGVPISIIALLMYGILVYLSTLFTSYVVGNKIANKLLKTKNNSYISLIIGIIILYILQNIIFIGGLVSFISLTLGLGFAYKLIFNKDNN